MTIQSIQRLKLGQAVLEWQYNPKEYALRYADLSSEGKTIRLHVDDLKELMEYGKRIINELEGTD